MCFIPLRLTCLEYKASLSGKGGKKASFVRKVHSNCPLKTGERFKRDKLYLKDCIDIFEKYGWDWTFQSLQENKVWSPDELTGIVGETGSVTIIDRESTLFPTNSLDLDRVFELYDGFSKNGRLQNFTDEYRWNGKPW
jgi:hypothetical protein